MPDDEVATSPHETGHPRAPVHPVRRAVVVAVAALALLAWSATLEVACAAGGGGPDGSLDMLPPCPAQSTRTAAAVVAAAVVLAGLVLLLVARRQAWSRSPGVERLVFVTFVVVTAGAVVAALFSTGFVAAT
ncbi:hypothetical protein [Oerskovia enterophila]|uniref:Uncharacterized protein n=1 Tax=Oerskovia enterophila TaxID=43678 RepID=A0ABX2Y337_9CELL|nr:hypothetical protein [Oerskovia enterophila]OCI30949.1 hypothetical protein OERS_22940 [Oerskovia enterophila]